MGGTVGKITQGIGQGIGAIVTGGTSLIPGSPTKKVGDFVGNALTFGTSGQRGLIPNRFANSGGNLSATPVGGTMSPLDMLTSSGGAPLLMDIALGAGVGSSIMNFLGAPAGDFDQWTTTLSPSDAAAVRGLNQQLQEIQNNTNTQNSAVKQLVNDYPNIMTQKIQQYQNVADPTIQKMMGQAMQELTAKQAAGGMLSSGASAEAAANIGAKYAGQELDWATGMAENDYGNQLSLASGLQQFQQKMLGQGAQNGFNAVQYALQGNRNIALAQAGYTNQANQYNMNQQNAMSGALGGLAGTVLGGVFGGPTGAAIGGSLGSTLGGNPSSIQVSPRLNFGGSSNTLNSPTPAPLGSYPLNLNPNTPF